MKFKGLSQNGPVFQEFQGLGNEGKIFKDFQGPAGTQLIKDKLAHIYEELKTNLG